MSNLSHPLPGPSYWVAGGPRGPWRLLEQRQEPELPELEPQEEERQREEQQEGEGELLLQEVEVVLLREEQIWVEGKRILFLAFLNQFTWFSVRV